MKTHFRKYCFFLFLVLWTTGLISCSSLRQFTIEVKEPADVILPVDIARVVVVNNSVNQPANVGVSQTYNDVLVKETGLDMRGFGSYAVQSLFTSLNSSRFFDEVSYSPTALRTDKDWMQSRSPLSLNIQRSLTDSLSFDGIISIDRILFHVDQKVKNNAPGKSSVHSHYVDMTINAQADGSIYIYNTEIPIHTFTVTDTLLVKETYYEDSLTVLKDLPEAFMADMINDISYKIKNVIAPSWTIQDRYLYTGGANARMKEAFSYTWNGYWQEAREVWEQEYAKRNNSKDKIKIAGNIALSYEMEDRLEEALEWGLIAQEELLQSNLKPDSKLAVRTSEYAGILKKRVADSRLLSKQLIGD